MPKARGHPWVTINQPSLIPAVALGFSSLLTQLIELREFLAILAGNELVIGIFLASSLFLTGLGAWLGGFAAVRARLSLLWLLVASAPLPTLQVAAIRLLRGGFAGGSSPSLAHIFLSALAVLLPGCLLFGLLFSKASAVDDSAGSPGRVYMFETIGAVAGGLTYTILTSLYTPVFIITCLLAGVNALFAAALAFLSGERRKAMAITAAAVAFVAMVNYTDVARLTLLGSFPGQEIVTESYSPYADLILTRSAGQLNLFENGLPLSSSDSTIEAERTVHLAMAQRPAARNVLVFGGAASGALGELLKYRVEAVDDVEIDSALVELASRVVGETTDSRLRLVIDDPRHYARTSAKAYDVIILAGPVPSTAASNRLYTVEFFRDLREILTPSGVISFAIGGSENYRGPESRVLNRALFTSLRAVFPNILVLPAGRLVFLASADVLQSNILDVLEAHGIKTSYVNRAYLQYHLTGERISRLRSELLKPGLANHDLEPTVYRLYLNRWLAELGSSSLWLALALLVVGFLSIRASVSGPGGPLRLTILTSGFGSLTLEFCLLLAFQMMHGSLFLQMGILVGAFMLGNALGAAAARGKAGSPVAIRLLVGLELAIGIAACVGAVALARLSATSAGHQPGAIVFSLALGLVGFLTGAEFPLAAGVLTGIVAQPAATLYAADLAGAAVGAATAGILLVPRLGIFNVCLLVAATKCLSAAMLLLTGHPTAGREGTPDILSLRSTSLFLLVACTLLIIAPGTEMAIYSLSFKGSYQFLLLAVLFLGLILTLQLRPFKAASATGAVRLLGTLRRKATSQPWRLFNVLAFSLPTFYPLVRCYFQIPYLFCHVCPRVCVFGYLRPFWVPGGVLMNLGSYSWCRQMCPLGAVFDPASSGQQPRRWPRRLAHGFRYAVLGFVGYSYFAMPAGAANESPLSTDLYSVLFKNAYSVSFLVLGVMVGLLLAKRWVPRSFCNLLCPVGASCDLLQGVLRHTPTGRPTPDALAAEKDETC